MSIYDVTKAALDEAGLPPSDAGTAAVLLKLAQAIDDIDAQGLNPAGKLDNVSIPTYLKYAESLGLTPNARARMKASAEKKQGQGPSTAPKDEVGERRARSWRTA